MLKINDKAPDFELLDTDNNKIRLSNFKNKTVVLYFYPKDSTPGCTLEACSFRDNFNQYKKKGHVILGISMDNQFSHKKFIEKHNLPFPLLCDDGKVCKLYDSYGKKKFMGHEYVGILRKTFIIKNMKILNIIEKINTKSHAKDILDLLGEE